MAEIADQIRRAAHLPENHDRHSSRTAVSVGTNALDFSGRYIRIAPDSKARTGFGPPRFSRAGVFELGSTLTKPLLN